MWRFVIARKLIEWIEEDAPFGDLTSDLIIPRDKVIKADIVLKSSEALVACIEDIADALKLFGINIEFYQPSGRVARRGDVVATLGGDARTILLIERTLLNLLSYCMGVASTARLFVERARKINPRVRIATTRKTPPGLREFAKKAASIGGADTHRLSLSDAILIKDNHIAIVGSLDEAITRAMKNKSFVHKIEVEIQRPEDIVKVARLGVDIVMLDNMSPAEVGRALELLEREGLREKVLVEVSGGITLDNLAEYVRLGPDIISSSVITMRPIVVDLSLEVV